MHPKPYFQLLVSTEEQLAKPCLFPDLPLREEGIQLWCLVAYQEEAGRVCKWMHPTKTPTKDSANIHKLAVERATSDFSG